MKIIRSVLFFLFLTCYFISFGQSVISGNITDESTGEALIGANILLVEIGTGTITDLDGNFKIELPPKAKQLKITYTGYEDQLITIADNTVFNIKMSAGKILDEVVVIGYGTTKKSDITGAVSSVKPEDQDVVQYDNFQDFLQGRATGVYVQSNGTELGAPNTIRIRGTNSLRGDNEPLYVVDGIIISSATEDAADPLSGGSSYLAPQSGLNGINPQDIESIEILKDASATAIYGSRGANGVVIITTKKGKSGKPKFNYKLTTRIGEATNLINVLDADQYVDMQNEWNALNEWNPEFYRYGDGSIATFINSEEFMEEKSDSIGRLAPVNWYEDIFQRSVSQNHRLSVSGGKEESNYYIAAGFSDAQGIIPGTKATQGDFLLKFDQKISDRLTVSPRISGTFVKNQASKGTENLGSANTSIIRQVILASPLLGYSENNLSEDFNEIIDGPRGWVEDYDDDATEFRTLASFKVDYKISDVFTYRFLAGGDYRNKKRQVWFGTGVARGRIANGEAGISNLNRFRYNIDNTLLFNKKINKKNKIDGTVGFILDETHSEQSTFSASNFANQDLRYDGISFGQVFQPLRFDRFKETLLSFLGRVNYSLQNKYIFTASFRGDGTSKFADGNKFSFFPSAAFAWKISKEKFFGDGNLFNELKLRVGYGRTGSQAIRPYQTIDRYGPTANLLSDGNGNGVTAIIPLNLENPNLIWETTDQLNAGIDFGIQEDRIVGSLDIYYKKTRDLLQELNIGPSAGFSRVVINQGSLINKGVELGLSAHILEGNFKWKVFGNISFNKNEINELGLPPAQFGNEVYSAFIGRQVSGGTVFKVPANIFIEGRPAGVFWGYQTDGIIQNDAQLANAPAVQGVDSQLGDVLYVDQNNDGNITDLDLTVIGDPNPDFTYGFGSEFKYKGFNLSLFFNGVQGNEIANGNLGREDYAPLSTSASVRTEAYLGAWREGATNATHPRLGYPIQGDFTDRMVEDGSFLRLTYVTFGYDIPVTKLKGIDGINVFVSGQNLWLRTNYSGFDPEVNSFSFDPLRQGIDWNSFPNQKSILFGLNVNF